MLLPLAEEQKQTSVLHSAFDFGTFNQTREKYPQPDPSLTGTGAEVDA